MRYFDLHCDTLYECYQQGKNLNENDLHLSLSNGGACRPWFQCFAVWVSDQLRGQSAMELFDNACTVLEQQAEAYPERLAFCKTGADLEAAALSGRCGAILTVEGGAAAAGSLERLRFMAKKGVRAMTLTWNAANEIGGGADEPGGLTDFGRACVEEMERLNIAVDVSHASDPLFWDVAESTKKPLIATHSNARALCGHRRNLTDAQFAAIRQRGGLVGLTMARNFLREDDRVTVDDLLRHAEHFLALSGEHTLAIGTDFDGTTLPDGVSGIASMEAVYEAFLRIGYAESLVDAIFFKNAYDFFVSL